MIQFFHYLFLTISRCSPNLSALATLFPSSLYKAQNFYDIKKESFEKYVICKKCGSLYSFKDCFETIGSTAHPKLCIHVPFRNHPHRSRRRPCGSKLIKEVITKQGKKFYPLKTYCYFSLMKSIPEILARNTLLDQCEEWRTRKIPADIMADVYDGRVWQDFTTVNGRPFLSEPHHLGLMLNCDWFQPFHQTQYSVGVMYLVIMNLPRTIRFKPENIIIVGIIPGPNEPKTTEMNSYLRPLVKELNALWTDGIQVSKSSGESCNVFAALMATVCDIPATQKLMGFTGHNSSHCCWKCNKIFPYSESLSRVDFSGSDVGSLRTHQEHKTNALKTLKANTPTERYTLEINTGSRFTEFMHLQYFDCIQFTIIDPMHNLFLGTAKRMLQNGWLENGLIRQKELEIIEERVSKCISPISIGRIPRKISSHFASLTADEWKNWTLMFSLIALHDILPTDYLVCWQLFISACSIYCSSIISLNDIERANDLMEQFFRAAERIYGPSFLTFNTHLHLHLHQCYRNYGPCYGYWLFSFERYNGILGKFHTNQMSIETQLMKKFIDNMYIKSLANNDLIPSEHHDLFNHLLGTICGGTASETIYGQRSLSSSTNLSTLFNIAISDVFPSLDYIESCPVQLLPPYVIQKFDTVALGYLRTSYEVFLPEVDPLQIPELYKKHKNVQWLSEQLSTKTYQNNFLCVCAYWVGSNGSIVTHCQNLCVGKVEYFFSQRIVVGTEYKEIIMLKISWFQEHPARTNIIEPVEIWCKSLFKPCGPASFMPVMRINQVCVACEITIDRETVLVINPVRRKLFC